MTALLDALARPVPLRRGLVLAVVGLALTTLGGWGPTVLVALGAIGDSDPDALLQVFLLGGAIALLGFVPLLLGALSLIARPAQPAWLLGAAIVLLLVRPAFVALEAITAPMAIVPPELTLPLLLTTAIAAGLAAISVLPTGDPARRPERMAVVGLGVAALIGLALYGYSGAIVPVAGIALVIAVALRLRRERDDADPDALDQVDDVTDFGGPSPK